MGRVSGEVLSHRIIMAPLKLARDSNLGANFNISLQDGYILYALFQL